MAINGSQLGDLVNLEGLKKPAEGVLKLELMGKPEKINKFGEQISGFASTVEDQKDLHLTELLGLIEALHEAAMQILSWERAIELMGILKVRFESEDKDYKNPRGIKWEDVHKRLNASPKKLWSLSEMERTGGEPDVFGIDNETAEIIFMDYSWKIPSGRTNCVYDIEAEEYLKKNRSGETWQGNAVDMAAEMGIELLSASEYRTLQNIRRVRGDDSGNVSDINAGSWVETPLKMRKKGLALHSYRDEGGICLDEIEANDHNKKRGFRGSLRV